MKIISHSMKCRIILHWMLSYGILYDAMQYREGGVEAEVGPALDFYADFYYTSIIIPRRNYI